MVAVKKVTGSAMVFIGGNQLPVQAVTDVILISVVCT